MKGGIKIPSLLRSARLLHAFMLMIVTVNIHWRDEKAWTKRAEDNTWVEADVRYASWQLTKPSGSIGAIQRGAIYISDRVFGYLIPQDKFKIHPTQGLPKPEELPQDIWDIHLKDVIMAKNGGEKTFSVIVDIDS